MVMAGAGGVGSPMVAPWYEFCIHFAYCGPYRLAPAEEASCMLMYALFVWPESLAALSIMRAWYMALLVAVGKSGSHTAWLI